MEEIDIFDFLRYYLSKFFIVVIFMFVILIVGNIYTLKIKTPLYKSDTTVILVSETEQQYTQSELMLNKNLVTTYSNIVKSKKVLNKVISNLNLNYSYNELASMIKVTNVDDTEIIKISVLSANKGNSALIANAIVPVFSKEIERIYGIENVSVLDEAVNSEKPCNIHFLKDNIIYFLISLFLGSAFVFIIYYFDTSVKSTEMIEDKLGLTVIGVVPKIEGRD